MTITEQAEKQEWGTVRKPTSELDALEYALSVLGGRDRPCSLGEVYAIKSLIWLKDKLKEKK